MNTGENIQTFGKLSIFFEKFSNRRYYVKAVFHTLEGNNEPLYNVFLFVILLQPISIIYLLFCCFIHIYLPFLIVLGVNVNIKLLFSVNSENIQI